MRKFLLLMPLICVALWGCQTKTAASSCDGWAMLTPTLESAVKITMDDRPFANQVAAHNLHGRKQGCWR